MTAGPEYIGGSFRDPSGRVFRHNGRIYRTITTAAAEHFEAVVQSGLIDELIRDGLLVGWSEADRSVFELDENVVRVIEHEKIPFVSYPYEWSFAALKAAALCHLDIQIRALDRNVVLSDATAYNIMLNGAKPVFIDYLSFRPYRDGEYWTGHKQFCEQFLNPLLLFTRFGIQPNAWFRGNLEGIPTKDMARLLGLRGWFNMMALVNIMLPGYFERRAETKKSNAETAKMVQTRKLSKAAYRGILERMRRGIARLSDSDRDTVWRDYAANTSYASHEADLKKAKVGAFIESIKPEMVWDIGCNSGEYSEIAIGKGAGHVVGFELDTGALSAAYEVSRSKGMPFTPLYMNLVNPSPGLGWNEREREGLKERRNADAIIALAVIHHICIARNIPLIDAVHWFVDSAPEGLIEFVPKQDPMVQELLSLREDIFDTYSFDAFCDALRQKASIVETTPLNEHGRQLVQYSVKDDKPGR